MNWTLSVYKSLPAEVESQIEETNVSSLLDLFRQEVFTAEEQLQLARLEVGQELAVDDGRILVRRTA